MCGIFTIIKKNNRINDLRIKNKIDKAISVLKSRGPDNSGTYFSDKVFMGHTRLSIIDLSENGTQPMIDDNENVIVFNGEIYNHKKIKDDLIKDFNEVFFSSSDTEVILKGFKHYGAEIFKKLRGPFAIVIFNKNNQKVYYARDTFGMKPLYYYENENFIFLSSNVDSISSVTNLKKLDIAEILYCKYGFIPEPFTQFKHLKSVEPGCVYSLSPSNLKNVKKEFLTLENLYLDILKDKQNKDFNSSDLLEIFSESVNSHLLSDVPIALFLSSGFDSTVIATLARKKSLSAITIGFQNFSRDFEIDDAKEICEELDINHITKIFSEKEVLNYFKEYIDKSDVPSNDGFNVFLVSKLTNVKKFKVALSGAGGDEILGSYPSFKQIPLIMKYKFILDFFFKSSYFFKIIKILFKNKINLNKLKGLSKIDNNIVELYKFKRSLLSIDELYENYSRKLVDKALKIDKTLINVPDKLLNYGNNKIIISYLETIFYLKSQLLRDADNFSMANSVELRTPFVDINLYRKALKISMNQHNTKFKFAESFIPKNILKNLALKKKKSFSTNIYQLFAEKNGFIGSYNESLKYTSNYIYNKLK